MQIKVAIIDDDFNMLRAIKNYCEQLNLEVVEANQSPKAFIDKLDTLKVDLVILDHEMPQLTGLELSQILSSKNIPFIFITAHRNVIGAKVWDLAPIDCIEKPFSIERLKTAISRYTDLSKNKIKNAGHYNFKIYGDKFAPISFTDIALITTCNTDNSHKYKFLQTFSGNKYKIYKMDLEELVNILPADSFARINKSEIISRNAIESYTSSFDQVLLRIKPVENECDVFTGKTKIELTISDSYRAQVKSWLSK